LKKKFGVELGRPPDDTKAVTKLKKSYWDEDRARWREIGEAYGQQWAVVGWWWWQSWYWDTKVSPDFKMTNLRSFSLLRFLFDERCDFNIIMFILYSYTEKTTLKLIFCILHLQKYKIVCATKPWVGGSTDTTKSS
jgi:hypothetical protein